MIQPKVKKTGGSLGTIFTGPANENPGVVKAKADKAKAIEKNKKLNTKSVIKPKYTLFKQANAANNKVMGVDSDYPATKKDSMDYTKGFNLGLKGVKLEDKNGSKYESNEFSRKGQWEGQNSPHSFKNRDAAIIAKKMKK